MCYGHYSRCRHFYRFLLFCHCRRHCRWRCHCLLLLSLFLFDSCSHSYQQTSFKLLLSATFYAEISGGDCLDPWRRFPEALTRGPGSLFRVWRNPSEQSSGGPCTSLGLPGHEVSSLEGCAGVLLQQHWFLCCFSCAKCFASHCRQAVVVHDPRGNVSIFPRVEAASTRARS